MVENNMSKESKNLPNSVKTSGLMGRSLAILSKLEEKKSEQMSAGNQLLPEDKNQKQVEVEVGNVGTMKTVDIIDALVEAGKNLVHKFDAPIVFKNGVYTIQNNLETSTVKIDPNFKALVESVCLNRVGL